MVLDMRRSCLVVWHRRALECAHAFGLDPQFFHDRQDRRLRDLCLLVVPDLIYQLAGTSDLVGRFVFVADQVSAVGPQCFGVTEHSAWVQPPVIRGAGDLKFLTHPLHRILAGMGFDEIEDGAYFLLFEAK